MPTYVDHQVRTIALDVILTSCAIQIQHPKPYLKDILESIKFKFGPNPNDHEKIKHLYVDI